jgi:hypothetical protein
MNSMFVWLLVAALAGGMASLALAYLAWRLWGESRAEAALAQIEDRFEQRVRKGVVAAGEQLLPAFREQVALGFRDALKDSHAAGIAEGTAKIVSGSTELVVESLSNLFGLKKK